MPNAQDLASIHIREWRWTQAEKIIARRAFDQALRRDLDVVISKAKERATQVTKPDELWDLEEWLGNQRRRIDSEFDYRYSVLPLVFTALLRSGRLTEDDLVGLDPSKLDAIRRMTSY